MSHFLAVRLSNKILDSLLDKPGVVKEHANVVGDEGKPDPIFEGDPNEADQVEGGDKVIEAEVLEQDGVDGMITWRAREVE